MIRRSVAFIFFLFVSTSIFPQKSLVPREEPPRPGVRMPDFALRDVRHFRKSRVSLADFKGQWLVLDLWYRGCGTCIRSFPKMDKLQAVFKDRIQFIMVGDNSSEGFGKGLDELYERLREKQHLTNLVVAYDSTLCDRWAIWSFPHVIIIDPAGIVRHVTTGWDLTPEKLQNMLDGIKVQFISVDDLPPFEPDKVTGASDLLLYRSLLTKWNGEKRHLPSVTDFVSDSMTTRFQLARVKLEWLYTTAYFDRTYWGIRDSLYGRIFPHPVYEQKDTSRFSFDFYKPIGIYNYELIVPKSRKTRREVMQIMQRELKNVFGYEAVVEDRMMPVWELVAAPGAATKLKAKGGAFHSIPALLGDGGVSGFSVWNCPMTSFFDMVVRGSGYDLTPYVDETGIEGNIDITVDALMTDRSQVIRELRKNGLDLVKSKKMMKALVIRDSSSNNSLSK
jgi:peroxiredoxin